MVVGRDASVEEAATFVAGLPGAVLLDARGDIGRALGVTMVPYTARFDRNGTVVQVVVGLTGGRGPTRQPGAESTTREGVEPW